MAIWSKIKIFKTAWLCFAIMFLVWNWTTFQSRNIPKDIFHSTERVIVTESSDMISFRSLNSSNISEVIFLQGGLTDPLAYAPLCIKIAENGFTCHLLKMAWRMPQYDYQNVSTLFNLKKGTYVIGGHSQGAKMAAQLVYENPNLFKGLFLLGTSHPRDIDLSGHAIPCLKLYAEKDGLASVEEVLANKKMLPKNVNLTLIKGGNHSQFGYLGTLLLDNSANISLETQQQQTLNYLVVFLNEIENAL
jgi:hypothetical protein